MQYIPIFKVQYVREGRITVENKRILRPEDAANIFDELIGNADREHFVIILTDTKNKVLGVHTVSIGTLNSSSVHAREVFKIAILTNSASIILGHNHPSGEVTPSQEDIDITKKLAEAGKLLEIEVLDHIIVSSSPAPMLRTYCSLKSDSHF